MEYFMIWEGESGAAIIHSGSLAKLKRLARNTMEDELDARQIKRHETAEEAANNPEEGVLWFSRLFHKDNDENIAQFVIRRVTPKWQDL